MDDPLNSILEDLSALQHEASQPRVIKLYDLDVTIMSIHNLC